MGLMGLTRKGREADFGPALVVDVTRNLAIAAPFLIADHPFILTLSRPRPVKPNVVNLSETVPNDAATEAPLVHQARQGSLYGSQRDMAGPLGGPFPIHRGNLVDLGPIFSVFPELSHFKFW